MTLWVTEIVSAAQVGDADATVVKRVLGRVRDRDGSAVASRAGRALMILEPGWRSGWMAVADIETLAENWFDASTAGEKAVRSGPPDARLGHMVAALAFRARRYEVAERLCEVEAERSDRPAGILFLQARASIRAGRVSAGRRALLRAVEHDRTFTFAASILRQAMTDADFKRAVADVDAIQRGS